MSLSPEAAETLALQALAWLVSNDELLPVFLGATGAILLATGLDSRDREPEPSPGPPILCCGKNLNGLLCRSRELV